MEPAEPINGTPTAEPIAAGSALSRGPNIADVTHSAEPATATNSLATDEGADPLVDAPHAASGDDLPLVVCGPRTLVTPTPSRRLTEILVIFAAAIIFFRAIAVEPFGVPTGSMAPTLIGNHRSAVCPRCGYRFPVGDSGRQQAHDTMVSCPNCGKSGIDLAGSPELAGDRLMVDKNVYLLRSPRRWEPAVFRCPSDLTKPYVKRVIGLPGERVCIADGDIYVNGRLARKTFGQCREMCIPVFDMNYPPKPEGWIRRWAVEEKPPAGALEQPQPPALELSRAQLNLNGVSSAQSPVWIVYKHHRFDDASGSDREEAIHDGFVYNGPAAENNSIPVHDFFIEFEVEVAGGTGSLHCRLFDGRDRLVAVCPVGTAGQEFQLHHEGKFDGVRSAKQTPLESGKKYHIEMAFIDRRVSFVVDGRELFAPYDLEACESPRPDVTSPVALGVKGVNVIIRNLVIYRDIYYRSSGQNGVRQPGLQLGPDEYFMLGDNSANSDDSRSWPIPGVPGRNFLGKPFLLHQPSRVTHLSIGGRERVFQSIDWSRVRFLR